VIPLAPFIKLIRAKKVLIDSNIIIYLTDSIHPYAPISQQLFNMVESGETEAVISILSISEVMQGPIRRGSPGIAMEIREYLANFPNSHCQEITYDVLEMIGKDDRIAWRQLRTVDSLIIASGLLNEVDLFISNDIHFTKAIPSNMIIAFNE
jgi:predicted nucleic acid-binding protein